jgi:serine/threonine protein kinase
MILAQVIGSSTILLRPSELLIATRLVARWEGRELDYNLATPYALRAPEIILQAGYDTKIDIWAVGCMVRSLCNVRPNIVLKLPYRHLNFLLGTGASTQRLLRARALKNIISPAWSRLQARRSALRWSNDQRVGMTSSTAMVRLLSICLKERGKDD